MKRIESLPGRLVLLVPFLLAAPVSAQTVPDLVDFQGYLRTESG